MLSIRIQCVNGSSKIANMRKHVAAGNNIRISDVDIFKSNIIDGKLHRRRLRGVGLFYLFCFKCIHNKLKIVNSIGKYSFYFRRYVLEFKVLNPDFIAEKFEKIQMSPDRFASQQSV